MLEHLLNVVTTASVFFTVSIGLLIVLSIMGVVNLAHGAFLTIGGYTAVVVSQYGWSPWLSLLLAPAVGFVFGLVTELILVRRLYGRPLDTILATWGLAIIVTQVFRTGSDVPPTMSTRSSPAIRFSWLGVFVSPYRALVIAIALLLGIGLTLVLAVDEHRHHCARGDPQSRSSANSRDQHRAGKFDLLCRRQRARRFRRSRYRADVECRPQHGHALGCHRLHGRARGRRVASGAVDQRAWPCGSARFWPRTMSLRSSAACS